MGTESYIQKESENRINRRVRILLSVGMNRSLIKNPFFCFQWSSMVNGKHIRH